MEELIFGKYPQNPDEYENGKRISIVNKQLTVNPLIRQPVEWLVLAEEEDKRLLISKYALEYLPFNDWTAGVTWEDCTLREWLNGGFKYKNGDGNEIDFINDCFSGDERGQIIPDSGTGDKVFLLSLDEVLRYLPSNHLRKCLPTAYAVSHLPETHKYTNGDTCSWWLRTVSTDSDRYIMTVKKNGEYFKSGQMASMKGIGVRPSLWVKKG